MDQHPIPQDVTGFQFKLIGTMTVKQFGYVASGVVMAVILYYLPLKTPLSLLIKLIFIPILGGGGAMIAFVPIDGRPVDVMASNFFKALFSPNQYIYHRSGVTLSFTKVADAKITAASAAKAAASTAAPVHATTKTRSDDKEEQLRVLLMGSQSSVNNALDKKEAAFLSTLAMPASAGPVAPKQVMTPTPIPTPKLPSFQPVPPVVPPVTPEMKSPVPPSPAEEPQKTETTQSLSQKENELEKELTLAKQQEEASIPPQEHLAAAQKVTALESQIQAIHKQKETLEQELSKLQSQLHQEKSTPPATQAQPAGTPLATPPQQASTEAPQTPAPPAQPKPVLPVQDPSHVRTIPQEITKKAGLPHVSDTPNVVVGIVKDPRGNVLSNILVEVKDKEGNPVRAFKTNALGQFASATPLSTGTYTMELEDPKKMHRFDIIQVSANNQIMLPIEVISHDAREELRQQLFAQ